jgi:hypothetical protein
VCLLGFPSFQLPFLTVIRLRARKSSSWAVIVRRKGEELQSFATVLSEELERVAGVLVRQAHPGLSSWEIKEAAGRAGHGVGRLNAVAGKINSLADNASEVIFDEVAKRRPRAIEVGSDHCIAPCIRTLKRPAPPTRDMSSTCSRGGGGCEWPGDASD